MSGKEKFDWVGFFIGILPFILIILALILAIWFPQVYGYGRW